MSSFKEHCLDESKVAAGVKLPLYAQDGSLSDDFVLVRWGWDDVVRASIDNSMQTMTAMIVPITAGMEKGARAEAEASNAKLQAQATLEARVAEVAGWSFAEKATPANIKAFLKARPDVAERIDKLSGNTKVFFTNSDKSS